MERLTMYVGNGQNYEPVDPIDTPYDYGKINLQKLVNKLAEYEILEEKGLLLRLPCNVGDTVYVIKNEEKQRCVIKSIIIKDNNIQYWYSQEMYVGEWLFSDSSIGKTVFLTEEEADQKLAEIRNNYNNTELDKKRG